MCPEAGENWAHPRPPSPGRRDSSGIRLHYTASLRPHHAGILELGLVYTPVMAIPPQETAFVLTGYCTDKCTQTVSAARVPVGSPPRPAGGCGSRATPVAPGPPGAAHRRVHACALRPSCGRRLLAPRRGLSLRPRLRVPKPVSVPGAGWPCSARGRGPAQRSLPSPGPVSRIFRAPRPRSFARTSGPRTLRV